MILTTKLELCEYRLFALMKLSLTPTVRKAFSDLELRLPYVKPLGFPADWVPVKATRWKSPSWLTSTFSLHSQLAELEYLCTNILEVKDANIHDASRELLIIKRNDSSHKRDNDIAKIYQFMHDVFTGDDSKTAEVAAQLDYSR